jgi:hypothetical protein
MEDHEGDTTTVYRIRRIVYEQFEPFKRKIIDAAVAEGLWEIVD